MNIAKICQSFSSEGPFFGVEGPILRVERNFQILKLPFIYKTFFIFLASRFLLD
jgi:hypothetical protein